MKSGQKFCRECNSNRKASLTQPKAGCVAPLLLLMLSLFIGLILAPLGLLLLFAGLVCIYAGNKGKWMCDTCGSDKVK